MSTAIRFIPDKFYTAILQITPPNQSPWIGPTGFGHPVEDHPTISGGVKTHKVEKDHFFQLI